MPFSTAETKGDLKIDINNAIGGSGRAISKKKTTKYLWCTLSCAFEKSIDMQIPSCLRKGGGYMGRRVSRLDLWLVVCCMINVAFPKPESQPGVFKPRFKLAAALQT